VYQPRGVGLIHPQPKPSKRDYTQSVRSQRKAFPELKATILL